MRLSTKRVVPAGLLALAALAAGTVTSLAATGGAPLRAFHLGQEKMQAQPIYLAYYDGHKDSYINTDDSNKAQAHAWHINYTPILKGTTASSSPEYFVTGTAAPGQLAVFGSEPPDPSYSPLWQEYIVTWKSGVKPVLLVRDDQIKALAAKGKLTLRKTSVILNAPILKLNVH